MTAMFDSMCVCGWVFDMVDGFMARCVAGLEMDDDMMMSMHPRPENIGSGLAHDGLEKTCC